MLDSLFTKQSRVRQPSIITGSSADTMSTITPAVVKKSRKASNKHDDGGGCNDTHSFHSHSSADDESSLVSVKSGITRCCKQGTLTLRRWQMFQMIFLPFIPITALIIQNSTLLSSVVVNLQEASEMKQQINTIVMIGKLLTELQQERAEFGFCLFTNAPETTLSLRFERTEKVVQNLSTNVANYVPTVASLRSKRERVFELTAKNDSADDTALNELLWYNVANDVILDLLSNQIRKTTTSGVWKVLIAYKNIIRCIENYSISMIYGLYYFGKGQLSQDSYNKYIQFDSLAADYLNATKSFSPDVSILWDRLIGQGWKTGFKLITERRAAIYRNDRSEGQGNDREARVYYANMTTYIDELRKFQRHLRVMIDNQVMDEMISARVKKVIAATLLVLVMLISPIIIFLVRNVTATIQSYSLVLSSRTADLKREKRKSDRLLQQMLPAEVIKQLKAKRQVPAESFESVTIYFSDIVSFTSISASSSPMEIVIMLNSLYKMFDSRIDNYDVYKVETIGDAYMVVSGLPLRNGNLHAGEICTMALDLIAGVRNFEIPHKPGVGLQIRVGINTGPCVSGVVGTKMPRFCLFGDSINVASRMESHGEPMKIHVTESTKILLDEIGGYVTEERGTLDIKGKGTMKTYWLTEKIGGIPRCLEMTTPGYFATPPPSVTHTPEFLKEIFGKGDSEEDLEAIQLNVKTLAKDLQEAGNPRFNPMHPSTGQRNSTTIEPTSRFNGCSPA